MAEHKRILIVCGEPSGDLHASGLARELLKLTPSLEISAVGGELLKRTGADVFADIKGFSVMGFFDVIRKLPFFLALKKTILEKIHNGSFDAVILVDFSGFNLRLAKAINKAIPVIYYVSPQVWASRENRIETIRRFVSKMIVIFKFEEEFYRERGMEVDFVGNPLLDTVIPHALKKDFFQQFGLAGGKITIALLPGSRKSEIRHILPVMLETAQVIRASLKETQFIIAKSPYVNLNDYCRIIKNSGLDCKIIENKTYDCVASAELCLVCSGTATVETAIMQRPFVIVYKMGTLNYLLYRPQVKVPYIGMVNIIAGEKLIPEFVQFQATGPSIAKTALRLLSDKETAAAMQKNLERIKSLLGEKGAHERAARIITDSFLWNK